MSNKECISTFQNLNVDDFIPDVFNGYVGSQGSSLIIMSGYEVHEGLFSEYINKKAILTLNKPVKAELLKKMIYYSLS